MPSATRSIRGGADDFPDFPLAWRREVTHPFRLLMSQHPSLKGSGAIKAKRSVLKRFERVELMKKRGQFKDGQRVIGLPKTKPEE